MKVKNNFIRRSLVPIFSIDIEEILISITVKKESELFDFI